jgi:DNA-binding MarR family transcriptional regulator
MSSLTKEPEEITASVEELAKLDLSALHRRTGFMIRIVQLQIFQAFFDNFSARGLTTGSYSALLAIRGNPGIQQGVLADCLLIKRSNMTKLINSLEERGLVERRGSANDKRAVDLNLTAQGHAFLAQVYDEVVRHDLEMTRALSDAERKTLLEFLARISDDLRGARRFEN